MITSQVLPTLPDLATFRMLYDEGVGKLQESRASVKLTFGFYAETGNAVFNAGYAALSDHCKGGPNIVRTVSAAAGTGKTTFSYALLYALTRYAEMTPSAPHGCVFVVDQIIKAEQVYNDLQGLMPGKVAVWTTEHEPGCKNRESVPHPAAEFTRDELQRYPVIVVTHSFYSGSKGHKAQSVVRDGSFERRALVVVDERPEEVEYFETTLASAQGAREALEAKCPDLREHLDALSLFMMPYTFGVGANCIGRATDAYEQAFIAERLKWFTSGEATDVLKKHGREIAGLDQLLGYAKALSAGFAMAVMNGTVAHFVGWKSKLMVRAGTLLLDATADIDGVSMIVPWRDHVDVPQARYDNLQIVHVPQHTKKHLKTYFAKAANQRAYVQWMEGVIREHVAPGERALVVCKKALFDAERVPSWPEGDPRFQAPEMFKTQYAWEIEGRKLCAIHWGAGIGRNEWQDADVVLLFDEFFIPRRIAAATVQGLRRHRADEGALAAMNTMNSKSQAVDTIATGHRLRWTKQMALRGRGRRYDEHGVCGKQRLVVSCDLKSFTAAASKLFPGAKVRITDAAADGTTWAHRILVFLSDPALPPTVTTKQLGNALRKPWRDLCGRVVTPDFEASLVTLGWRYSPSKGRGGSRFQRVTAVDHKCGQSPKEDISIGLSPH